MTTAQEIFDALDRLAPFALQMEFDNAGFLVGDAAAETNRILVALDITEEVIQEAAQWGAQLIVSHHPVIFHPLKAVCAKDPVGRRLMMLVRHRIGAICCHTNLDAVQGGVNDCLAQALGLTCVEQLHADGVDGCGSPYGIGRVGVLPHAVDLSAFLTQVKDGLKSNGLRYCEGYGVVRRVAVGGGACGGMLKDAVEAGCDTFVTADVKYDVFLEARACGINLIDAGHFPTEDVVCPRLVDFLSHTFPQIQVQKSVCHREVISYR